MIEVRPYTGGPMAEAALTGLFADLYAHLGTMGLAIPLAPDGAATWVRTIGPMLGKLTFVHGAWLGEDLRGFVAGAIRTMPSHLGGTRIGALTHIHIDPSLRGQGVGRRLHDALLATFLEKGVQTMETDVLVGNTASR